ncbi:MAG: FIST C-terminal domain-containing protein [Veillonellaceae bacterium]|nr:FIST C-terminal domain-containing protein [Veillonellaceae bacterium]
MKSEIFNISHAEEILDGISKVKGWEISYSSMLVMIFAAERSKEEFMKLADIIHEAFPSADIAGGSVDVTAGEGYSNSEGFSVGFIAFRDSKTHVGLFEVNEYMRIPPGDLAVWYREIEQPKVVGLLVSGHVNFEDAISFTHIDVQSFGGIMNTGDGYCFGNGRMVSEGLVVIAFSGGSLRVKIDKCSGWQPIGRHMRITKLGGPYVIEKLDGRPFSEVYRYCLGEIEGESLMELTLLFPLMLYRNGKLTARHPLLIRDDGAAVFSTDFIVGEEVQIGYGNPARIIYEAQHMQQCMASFMPQCLLLADCISRWRMLSGDTEQELRLCRSMGPSVGFFGTGRNHQLRNTANAA